MKCLFGASFTIALAAAIPALAADLPEVKITESNQVPACATPGRLMAFVRSRNSGFDSRFDAVPTEYMRHGESLGIRWDMAFFQMLLETGNLGFTGDVRAKQNNFAGLGATGRRERGESFPDISTGVKAHLQHLLMYAGDTIENPVAERTRKVQEWGVLTDWQRSIKGPMTFALLAEQWAPGSHNYVRFIRKISADFYDTICNAPDPKPELVQEARKGREDVAPKQVADGTPSLPQAKAPAKQTQANAPAKKHPGAEIASRAIKEARKEGAPRASLGAGPLSEAAEPAKAGAKQQPSKAAAGPAVTLLNPVKTDAAEPKADKAEKKGADFQTASVGGAATKLKVPTASGKCKVWTASYGGQHAIIIKAAGKDTTNYTVLDVNEKSQKREVEAYIAAYAKGGEPIGEFPNQTKALDKAFELCPEG